VLAGALVPSSGATFPSGMVQAWHDHRFHGCICAQHCIHNIPWPPIRIWTCGVTRFRQPLQSAGPLSIGIKAIWGNNRNSPARRAAADGGVPPPLHRRLPQPLWLNIATNMLGWRWGTVKAYISRLMSTCPLRVRLFSNLPCSHFEKLQYSGLNHIKRQFPP